MRVTPEVRFMAMVNKTDSCWLWTGARNPSGYSTFKFDRRTVHGHRWAYEHFVGPIPDGLELDHTCRVTLCVNPDHLEPVTHLENVRRAATGLVKASHCGHGHEFTPENTRIYRGARVCRACDRRRAAEYQERRRLREAS